MRPDELPATKYFAALGNQASAMAMDDLSMDDDRSSEGNQVELGASGLRASRQADDMDDFVKMDITLQMDLLHSKTAEEKVQIYKVYVSKLLHELVATETASEDLEYELQLKNEQIAQMSRRIDDLNVLESVQTMTDFEESVDVEAYLSSPADLRSLFKQKDAELTFFRRRVKRADDQNEKLQARLSEIDQELARATIVNRQLKTDLQNEVKRREESNKKTSLLREKLNDLRKSSSPKKTAPETLELQEKLIAANEIIAQLRAFADADQATKLAYQNEVNALTSRVAELEASHAVLQDTLTSKDHELRQIHEEAKMHVDAAENRLRKSEVVRRTLHNQVMELKGNIRVFCRVRPPLPSERSLRRPLDEMYSFPDYDKEKKKLVLVADARTHTSYTSQETPGAKKWPFEFDQVFDWTASQEEMFAEVAALVQSAVDGYNVSIFAYGQTGSGKTYTMQGDEAALTDFSASHLVNNANLGIVGRTMTHIFATCKHQAQHGWEYTIAFEMYEIYNESIKDLMAPPGQPTKEVGALLDGDGNVHVTNLHVVNVQDERHAMQLLKQATARRSMKKTQRNDVSSRSHCITTLRLTGTHATSGSVRTGAVYLIDLAGSERLKSSGSGNDPVMLKEAQNINKSLAALGNVISAIASKKSHVPFRDTKLTYVLQNTLGKDSKTLMICTLSPLEEHREESLNTLRFAKKVNACELAVAGK
ncbi:hypothetical protein SPRG_10585 [Saprolegnia parasitica CBS 223.65]|uniref:Kinesin motor domain-containing protein n=1 Tax=Saprolegnia parasitica (strain CBS 223.65) TaxID=695850 RepID=A0A067C0W1_SAPPC|nr:hypothetical protein SPRG_10585 [Saprolegnia parasitica CBS 223.65]KDO24158.1 hypothetical protein SPRG_10585 [Saprolegnia parasitica CBS 223.65]|eukprot:XP_012205102.1 hypothetical protein SPRG_10585 [Saprolegnia parasitica CBS 223.65]